MIRSLTDLKPKEMDYLMRMDRHPFLKTLVDWLSLSYPASSSPLVEILDFLGAITEYQSFPKGKGKTLYTFSNGGTLFVSERDGSHNFSFSGQILGSLRGTVHEMDFLMLLRSRPSNITRLDVAFDVPISGCDVISSFRTKFPDGLVSIAGHPRKLLYQLGSDYYRSGAETGTVYFQNSKYSGYVKLRVYDKINEILDGNPSLVGALKGKRHTRYELTVSKGASLDDFARPDSIFWHYMPHVLLKPPEGLSVAPWKPTERVEYDSVPPSHITDYERLRVFLEESSTLRQLVAQSHQINGGLSLLHRIIDQLSPDGYTP